jgi:hypothetical protein
MNHDRAGRRGKSGGDWKRPIGEHQRKSLLLALGFLMLISTAALMASAQAKWKGSIVREGDVTIVKNPKEPLYKTPVLELKEDLSLGGPDAQGDYVFGEVRNFVVGDDGAIYVLDAKLGHIKVFDMTGKHLRSIGRSGQGPGELDRPRTLSLNRAAGELAVLELARRMSFFKLDGTFLRHVSFKEIWALYGHVDSKGRIYVTEGFVDPKDPRYELKKLGPEAAVMAMLIKTPGPAPGKFNPFMAVGYWRIGRNDRIVFGYPETYEIQVFGEDNSQVALKFSRDYDPVAITEEEKAEQKKDTPPGINLAFSKHHSAYYRFFLSDLGHVIVQTWEKTKDGRFIHDIFDAEGRFIGRVPLKPSGSEILKGTYYALETDEDGYQYVKRYAVNWKVK